MSSSPHKTNGSGMPLGVGVDFLPEALNAILLERTEAGLLIREVASYAVEDITEYDDVLNECRSLLAQGDGLCLALPPGSATDLVQEVPCSLSRRAMKKIVQGQVATISNYSTDRFVHDYQVMPSVTPGKSGILTSLAREEISQVYLEHVSAFSSGKFQISSQPLALASAFMHLHPKEAKSLEAQFLLNVGKHQTAVAVIRGGSVQFSGFMMFGHANEAANIKNISGSGKMLYGSEFAGVISRWRENSHETGDVKHIWLAGSGDLSKISEMTSNLFQGASVRELSVPRSMLAPSVTQAGQELVVCFGLALQALCESSLRISLLPEKAKWVERKRQEFPYLLASAAMFSIGVLMLLLGLFVHINRSSAAIISEKTQLDLGASLLPVVGDLQCQMYREQLRVLPIVEAAHRNFRFMEALAQCQNAQKAVSEGERIWEIYFADEFTLAREIAEPKAESKGQEGEMTEEQGNVKMNLGLFGQEPAKTPALPGAITVKHAASVEILKNIFVGGMLSMGEQRYKPVKDMQAMLMQSGTYKEVDDHTDMLTAQFVTRYFAPWTDFLNKNQAALQSEYSSFFLQLPFAQEQINSTQIQKYRQWEVK